MGTREESHHSTVGDFVVFFFIYCFANRRGTEREGSTILPTADTIENTNHNRNGGQGASAAYYQGQVVEGYCVRELAYSAGGGVLSFLQIRYQISPNIIFA